MLCLHISAAYIYIYIYIYIYVHIITTYNRLSNATCLTQVFFKSGEECSEVW